MAHSAGSFPWSASSKNPRRRDTGGRLLARSPAGCGIELSKGAVLRVNILHFRTVVAIQSSTRRLVDLTGGLIEWFAKILNIKTPIVLASDLPVQGKRTELLAEICTYLGASVYMSPIGSAAYLLEEMGTSGRHAESPWSSSIMNIRATDSSSRHFNPMRAASI